MKNSRKRASNCVPFWRACHSEVRTRYRRTAEDIGPAATKPGIYGDEMVGSPETILRNLEEMRGTWSWEGMKPTEIIIRTPPPGVPLKEYESSFELFVREVMPEVRKW